MLFASVCLSVVVGAVVRCFFCVLFDGCCVLVDVDCLLLAACCALCGVCCLLFDLSLWFVCCML